MVTKNCLQELRSL